MLKSTATLKERLSGWTDWDMASYQIGVCLGFWADWGGPYDVDPWHEAKSTIWSANPLGNGISNLLLALVEEGMLERRDEPDIQYRWNKDYKGLL